MSAPELKPCPFCGRALPAIHGALSQVHPDVMVQCKDTGVPKVRPRARKE